MNIWRRRRLRGRAVVLMYHRVLTDSEVGRTASHPAIAVSLSAFERHMAILRKTCHVLSLEEFASHLDQRIPFPDASVLVTFDDGWRDNYTNAFPVLRRYSIPALVFLPAHFIGTQRLFWQESLVHLLLTANHLVKHQPSRCPPLETLLRPFGLSNVLSFEGTGVRHLVIDEVGKQKDLARSDVDALVSALAREVGVDPKSLASTDAFLDWSEVREMARNGITFGGHGVEHLLLTRASADEVEAEVHGSKRFLDTSFESTLPTFSYPNGYVDDAVIETVREAGFRLAFTTTRGFVDCTAAPLSIRRLNVHESVTRSAPLFMARLLGLF